VTTRFNSLRFSRDVHVYEGFVIVPVDTTGRRGGDKRFYEVWSNDQRIRYNRNVRTIGNAKALIDTGSYPSQQEDVAVSR
jgi:hypothetical protein